MSFQFCLVTRVLGPVKIEKNSDEKMTHEKMTHEKMTHENIPGSFCRVLKLSKL
jgi:hypothetical protein